MLSQIKKSRPLFWWVLFVLLIASAACAVGGYYIGRNIPLLYRTPSPRAPISWTSLPVPVTTHSNWRSYTSTSAVRGIARRGEFLWVATDGGLVVYDLVSDQAIQFLVEHGLPSNRLTAVTVAADGTIWVGSANAGVGMYDGVRWVTYTAEDGLPSNQVHDLVLDGDGAVWIATDVGVGRYDGQSWQWVRPSLLDFSTTEIRDLAYDARGIWAATAAGLWHFDGRSWETFTNRTGLISDNLYSVTVGADGSIWAGGDRGLSRYSGSRWERFSAANGLVERPIISLSSAADGSIYLAYDDAPLSTITQFDGLSATTYPLADPTADPHTIALLNGQMWVGTSAGLTRLNAGVWEPIALPTELPSNQFSAIAEQDGQLWLASEGGVQRFDGRAWEHYTAADGLLEAPVRGLDIWGEQIVVGYEHPNQGVSIWQDGSWQNQLCVSAGVDIGQIFDGLVDHNGDVWLLGKKGVAHYNGRFWTHYTAGWPADPLPRQLALAPSGEMWLALQEGLYRLEQPSGRWVQERNEDIVRLSIAPNGSFWFATPTGLYQRVDGRDLQVPAPAVNGLQGFLATNEAVWISGNEGVYRFANNEWTLYTTADGLASDRVTALALSPRGQVWAAYGAAGLGFSYFDGQTWQILHNNQGIESDGLISNQVNDILATPDGLLWFATAEGLSRYDISSGAWGTIASGTEILQLAYAYDVVWARTASVTARVEGNSLRQTDMMFSASDFLATAPDGRLWAAVLREEGATFQLFDGDRWGIVPGPEQLTVIDDIAFEANGRVWLVGTPAGGEPSLYVWNQGQWTSRELPEVARLAEIEIDPSGRLWVSQFAEPAGRVFEIDEAAQLRQVTAVPALSNGALENLTIDPHGRVFASAWVDGEGVLYQLQDGRWAPSSLPTPAAANGRITQLTVAPNQVVWVGSSEGAARYADGVWEYVQARPARTTQHSLLSSGPPRDPVTKLTVTADNAVWFGTSLGEFGRLQAGSLLYTPSDPTLRMGTVSATLIDDEGAVWIVGVNGRIIRFREGVWQRFDQRLATAEVQTVVAAAEAVWLGTDEGAVRVQPDDCQLVTNREQDLFVAQIGLADAAGNIWWGTPNAGAVRYQTAAGVYDWPELSLRSRRIEAMARGVGGDIWFYYEGRLVRYANGLKEIVNVPADFVSGEVTALLIDGNQRPWLGTTEGVFFPSGAAWRKFTTADGLADNHVTHMLLGRDGSLWFVTRGGLSHYRP